MDLRRFSAVGLANLFMDTVPRTAHKHAMTRDVRSAARPDVKPLSGARGWVITDGNAGNTVQVRGVADALGLDYELKIVHPKGVHRFLAPWAPVARSEQLGTPGSLFAPPWPAVAIATGRASIPYIRAIKRQAGAATFTVVLQDPKTGSTTADLIWVPEHDRRRGINVIATPTSPHSYTSQRLEALRATMLPDIAALPRPRIAIALGGRNGVYKFTCADDKRLAGALTSLGELGTGFMITPSRRTHPELLHAAEEATRGYPRILWDGTGHNPYPAFLAHADAFVVTADSVNMTGECCATGKPVFVFVPSAGSAKFRRFHDSLARHGATRPLPDHLDSLPMWTYTPLNSAAIIAGEIEERWSRRYRMLSGLMQPALGYSNAGANDPSGSE